MPLKDAGILSLHRFRRFGPLLTTIYYFFCRIETLSKTPFALKQIKNHTQFSLTWNILISGIPLFRPGWRLMNACPLNLSSHCLTFLIASGILDDLISLIDLFYHTYVFATLSTAINLAHIIFELQFLGRLHKIIWTRLFVNSDYIPWVLK